MFRKHQEEANDSVKKPMVAVNVVTSSVCVMTKAQRAVAKEKSKKESESKDENEKSEKKWRLGE